MSNINSSKEFNIFFPKEISNEFLFSSDSYLVFLEKLSINPFYFFEKWSDINRQSLIDEYWKPNTKLDWKWSLSFPLFSLLEKYVENFNHPKIIGFSAIDFAISCDTIFPFDNPKKTSAPFKASSSDLFFVFMA